MVDKSKDLEKMTLGELFSLLRPNQLWALLAAILAILIGTFFLGERINEIVNAGTKIQLEQEINRLKNEIRKKDQEIASFHSKKKDNIIKSSYPKIDRTSLRYGLSIGWQLGRFEFADDSKFPEVRTIGIEIHNEISRLLKQDNFPHDFMNLKAPELMRTVINYYGASDIQKHSAILIGLAAFRASLVGASSEESHNLELQGLSLGVIREVDGSVVPQKMKLFDALLREQPNSIPDLIVLIDTHWQKSQ